MTKEFRDISEFIGLETMNGRVLQQERLIKGILIFDIEKTESLTDETIIFEIRPLIGAALNEHVA
jgi:hypothetical protein